MRTLCTGILVALIGCSADPPGVTGPPMAPSEVRALPGNQFVRVSWTDNSEDELDFVIYREITGPSAMELVSVAEVGADVTEFDDLDVTAGTTYRYAVAARGEGGESEAIAMDGEPVSPLPGSIVDCTVIDPTAEDQDGDGLTDADELGGWTVSVIDGLGQVAEREVSSGPLVGDTDGDGLCDREERQSGTDPNVADTDGDGLSDPDELRTWGSKPTSVDSDGDSQGNAALFDGNELSVHLTSPTIADTDGDGIDDYVEIIERGGEFGPLVANVPVLELDLVGETDVVLNVAFSDGSQQAESRTVSMEREATTAESSTRSSTHEAWAEVGITVSTEAQASFPAGASVKTSKSLSASAGYAYTNTRSVTKSSSRSSRQAYQRGVDTSRQENREIADGELGVGFVVRNAGAVSFELSDLTVTALQRDVTDPARFTPIATLDFADPLVDGVTLGPDASTGTVRAASVLPANRVLELLADPESLFFEVATFDLVDEEGRNFEFLRETTNAQTGQVIVDFGNGTVIDRRVATNVERENGRIVGIPMREVMTRALGLDYRTAAPDDDGPEVLVAVTMPSGQEVAVDELFSRYWAVIGSEGTQLEPDTAFDDIRLRAGESITLFYAKDRDGDGLFAHEEYVFGTSEEATDGDGDGLTDFEETKLGWSVAALVPPYPASTFSDPNEADADGDGRNDAEERDLQTDPYNADTDGDGFCDGPGLGDELACPAAVDPDPLDPAQIPVVAVASFLFEGDLDDSIGGSELSPVGGCFFGPLLYGADRDGFADRALDIEVSQECTGTVNEHPGLRSDADYDFDGTFSLSLWVATGQPWTNADWYLAGVEGVWSLRLENQGGSDAWRVAYYEADTRIFGDPVDQPGGVWRQYTMTVDGATVRLYRDGIEVASGPWGAPSVTDRLLLLNGESGDFKYLTFAGSGRGRFDDVYLYDDALPPNAVLQAFNAQN